MIQYYNLPFGFVFLKNKTYAKKQNINKLALMFLLFFGFSSYFANAQVIIPAANTNSGSVNDPFGTWYGFERSAMIYTNAQIGTTGLVTNVGFYVNSVASPQDAVDVRIYMKMRTTIFTANTTYASETTGATLVYGPITIPAMSFVANNWTTVALATPFNYTGDNLEIIIETNATGTGNGESSTGKQFRYNTQTNNRFYQYWNRDNTAPVGNGTRSNSRPNVSLTVVPNVPCVAPTAQPTALNLSAVGTTITGNFTAASPAPNSYLVVLSTSATPPTPTNGTTYTVGSTIGAGYTVVDTDSNTTFSVTGLSSLTVYYVYVFSYNNFCSGGPLYYTTSPLSGSTTTFDPIYCEPTSWDPDGLYINSVAFVGALTDPPVNPSTFNATGFQNFTGLPTKAIQAQGEGINVVARSIGTIQERGTWKAWVDWNKNGTFDPATEEVYNIQGFASADVTFGFVIPPLTVPGDYRIRIRVNNGYDTFFGSESFGFDFSPCDPFEEIAPYDFWIKDYGETEDYLFTVVAKCNSLITSVTNGSHCGTGTVNLGAAATTGVTEFRWYSAATAGTLMGTSAPSGTTTTFTTASLATTTNYYVTAWDGSCESQVRTLVVAKINPTPVLAFTPSNPIICGENTILQLTATGDKEITYLIDEDFEGGGLGLFSNTNNDANGAIVDAITSWKNQTSTFVPTATNAWFPAVSSGFGTNKFALAYSDSNPFPTNTVENSIVLTSSVNTNTFLNLTLKLKLYYSRYFPDGYIDPLADEYVNIELSTNGGATYPNVLQTFTSDIGIGSRFAELSYDLSAYINQPNLKIRIRHRSYAGGGWLPDGVAIDNVELFGEKPLNTAFNYDTTIVDAYTNPGATIPYTSGTPATTIYIRPTLTQLENPVFLIPVSTTLSNGCSVSGNIVVTNNSKIYRNPTIGSNWNSPNNWKPNGVPTADNCVIIINNTDITGTNYQAFAKNLRVESTGNLNLGSSNFLTVTEKVTVIQPGGVFDIENNGSLVQIDNVVNEGPITYKRDAVGIKGGDYVYWSSPVLNQPLNTIYSSPTSGPKYKWNTLQNNGNGVLPNVSQGTWQNANGNTMEVGKGYIVRGSSSSTAPAVTINSAFSGVPNNGTIPITIERGMYTGAAPYAGANGTQITNLDDNWNLVGNPYPSAIYALQFLEDNKLQILGNVRLWTHGSDIAQTDNITIFNPFYGSFAYNYSSSDYNFINYLGPTVPVATNAEIIRTGQAFFVQMVDGPGDSSGTINFNNGQRKNTYANNNFYRTTEENQINEEANNNLVPERHRLWLDIVNSNNKSITTLVGYASGASNEKDSKFDANEKHSGNLGIYSMIGSESFAIQGRALPFEINDEIPIAFNVGTSGAYHLAILALDGLFEQQAIYLKDELLNVFHDLKVAPYHFTSEAGYFANRFKIVYQNETFDIPEFNNNNVVIYKDKLKAIQISTGNYTMAKVKIHDISGRLLLEKDEVNSNLLSIENLKGIADQVLLVTIITSENKIVTKKVF